MTYEGQGTFGPGNYENGSLDIDYTGRPFKVAITKPRKSAGALLQELVEEHLYKIAMGGGGETPNELQKCQTILNNYEAARKKLLK